MPSSRQLIASQVLGTAAASVTFSSIPNTFSDLSLKYSVRHNGVGGNVWFFGIQVNSDTTANYSDSFLVSTGSSAIASGVTSGSPTDYHAGAMVTNNYTASTFSNGEFYMSEYLATQNKAMCASFVVENQGTAANYYGYAANLYRGTAAVTQLVIKPNGSVGSFAVGSSFYLYGIKNS